VGLLAREIEAKGVTTVGLGLVKEVAVAARAPRFLYLHWPFGHALGEPGNVAQQRTVLHDMLTMAALAPRPGLVIDLPYLWRRETYPPVADWKTPSKVVVAGLRNAGDTGEQHADFIPSRASTQ
jgi:D-proline reductase (dithiol) PrdB